MRRLCLLLLRVSCAPDDEGGQAPPDLAAGREETAPGPDVDLANPPAPAPGEEATEVPPETPAPDNASWQDGMPAGDARLVAFENAMNACTKK